MHYSSEEIAAMLRRFKRAENNILILEPAPEHEQDLLYFLCEESLAERTTRRGQYRLRFAGRKWLDDYETTREETERNEKYARLSLAVSIAAAVLAGLSLLATVLFGVLPYLTA